MSRWSSFRFAMPDTPTPPSWIDSLADFLLADDKVEAIRVNPEQRTVSVATLGQVNEQALQA